MAAEAVDCISDGASRITIDFAVLGGTYAIANNGHSLSGPGNTHTALGEMPAANCSHKASA